MNKLLLPIACVSLGVTNFANAIMINSSVGGAPTGVSYVNFDDLSLGSGGGISAGPSGSVGVSFTSGDSKAVQGSASGLYAAPFLSGLNGSGFGNPAAGADTTTYLSTGIGSVELTFSGLQQYFGLLWGSVDNYNTLSFYNGATLVDSVTGSQVIGIPNGDQGVNGTVYVNINTSSQFNRVVASSTQYAFEFDNVAYNPTTIPNIPSRVPDGGMTLSLLGVALGGLGLIRRKF